MTSERTKKILIFFMLGLLTASAFFLRLENFKNSRARSIDEIVYYRMGKQVLEQGFSGYNTIPYAKELAASGRPLPDYFFHPIFKYPPLFTYLIAFCLRLFGGAIQSAYYASLVPGVLMIPMAYILGSILFGRRTGMIAALFVFMDPVSIICSQKVWMESLLAFFTVLSVLFFVQALKKQNKAFFLLSGLGCGLAALTKYPGILLVPACLVYAWRYDKELLRDRAFVMSLIIPFLLLAPWEIWIYGVYSGHFLVTQIGVHSSKLHQQETLVKFGLIVPAVALWYILRRRTIKQEELSAKTDLRYRIALGMIAATIVFDSLVRALTLTSLPVTSWGQIFYHAPPTFYFGRLLEFSPVFLFSYSAFFVKDRISQDNGMILKAVLGVLMVFYVFWGNYQSRYILACIPFFIILGAHMILEVSGRISRMPRHSVRRNFSITILILFLAYILIRTNYINLQLSFPNDLCYF
ncbi:MAG TPA: glycosyltransferase family 39 protein [Candidatus Omnitrophota bacterium]|nr:glycosyltransferase family 39 protein [Candidatus Omnitrophota bacterium]